MRGARIVMRMGARMHATPTIATVRGVCIISAAWRAAVCQEKKNKHKRKGRTGIYCELVYWRERGGVGVARTSMPSESSEPASERMSNCGRCLRCASTRPAAWLRIVVRGVRFAWLKRGDVGVDFARGTPEFGCALGPVGIEASFRPVSSCSIATLDPPVFYGCAARDGGFQDFMFATTGATTARARLQLEA